MLVKRLALVLSGSRHAPPFQGVIPAAAAPGSGQGRIPTLDGLRALAMLGVLMVHLEGTRGLPRLLDDALAASPFDVEHLRVSSSSCPGF